MFRPLLDPIVLLLLLLFPPPALSRRRPSLLLSSFSSLSSPDKKCAETDGTAEGPNQIPNSLPLAATVFDAVAHSANASDPGSTETPTTK